MSDIAVIDDPVPTPPVDHCTPLTPADFRSMFSAFSDETIYTDAMIQQWLDLCPIDCQIWNGLYRMGMGLWTAHELTKFGPNGLASSPGATGIGIITSKSVDGVSLSYDNNVGADPEAGQLNMTIYGRQFWWLLKHLPIGPIQVGAATPPFWWPSGGGWLGPWPWPGPGMSGFG